MHIPMPAKLAGRTGAALLILLLAGGTAFAAAATVSNQVPSQAASGKSASHPAAETSPEASESPESSEAADTNSSPDGSPSPANLDRIVGLLKDQGITTTSTDLASLVDKVGVGGAVRVLAFAKESGKAPAEIVAMFQAGEGWGQIAKDLKVSKGPGIGWIMGHGKP